MTRMRRRWLAILLLLWVTMAASQQHIFPILMFGPSNQKRDLRHILALAKELQTGIILTGLFKHYLETNRTDAAAIKEVSLQHAVSGNRTKASRLPACFPEAHQGFMPLTQVIDRVPLDAWVPTTTVADLKARGWDGQLDVLVHPADRRLSSLKLYISRACMASGVTLRPDAPVHSTPTKLGCQQGKLQQLHNKLKPYRYIGLVMVLIGKYNKAPDLRREAISAPKEQCSSTIYEADRLLRPAPWISALADSYITQHITQAAGTLRPGVSGGGGFMAVHVRPYPDDCMEAWQQRRFDTKHIHKACLRQHHHLHEQIGQCVAKALQHTGIQQVFVLTHPDIRDAVDELLLQAGVKGAAYMDVNKLNRLADCDDQTATFQLMVEEAIAVQAQHFLGTHGSSITHNIVYQRLSKSPHASHSFLDMGTC